MAIVESTFDLVDTANSVAMTSWPQATSFGNITQQTPREFVVGNDKIDFLQFGLLKFNTNPAIAKGSKILLAGLKNVEALEVNTEDLTLEIAALNLDGRWDLDGGPTGPAEAVGLYCRSFTLKNLVGVPFDFVGDSVLPFPVPIDYSASVGARRFGQACFNHSGQVFGGAFLYSASIVMQKTAGTTGNLFMDIYLPAAQDGTDDRPMGTALSISVPIGIAVAIPLDDTNTVVSFLFTPPTIHLANFRFVYMLRTDITPDGVHFVSVMVESRTSVGDKQVGLAIKQAPGIASGEGFSDGAYSTPSDLPLMHDESGALVGGTQIQSAPASPRSFVYPHADRVTFAATPFSDIGGVHHWPSTDGTNPTGLEGIVQRWIDDPRYPHGDASLEPFGLVISTPAGVPANPPARERVVALGTPQLFVQYQEPVVGCPEYEAAIDDAVDFAAALVSAVAFEAGLGDAVAMEAGAIDAVRFVAGLTDAVDMSVGLC